MNDKAAKKSTFYLRLQEMSPYLSSLAATSIPIPGQELVRYDHEQIVSIARMNKHAMVLPTKTRPKKVSFLGSDGNEYVWANQTLILVSATTNDKGLDPKIFLGF
jgi:serine/threonine-protein kinase SMG1